MASLAKWLSVHLWTKWCGFKPRCSHLIFRYRACFEQGVPWHSGNYRVWIHSEKRTWHCKNTQSILFVLNIADIMRKMRLICHLKHSFALERKKEEIYNPSNHDWLTFWTSFESRPQFCAQIQNLQFFPQEIFTEPDSTDHSYDWYRNFQMTRMIKYYKSRSIYDHTRLWKVSNKKLTNHCSFSTKN